MQPAGPLCFFRILKLWHDRIIEDSACATHSDLLRAPFASDSFVRLRVNTTVLVLTVTPQEADVAVLAPVRTPGVLHEPKPMAVTPSVSVERNSVIHDVVALIEDSAFVAEPAASCHRDSHRSQFDKCPGQWLLFVAGEHAEPGQSKGSSSSCGPTKALCLKEGILAGAILRGIWHGCLQAEAMLHRPANAQLNRGPTASALAATFLRIGHAVHQLLA
mmetsp:Transcript_110957/g.264693  ORF Transcript_110957/g.264693 Transcript_110957/m.264693 type:complete len:218 (-) Transcript_110957:598-1251(-)